MGADFVPWLLPHLFYFAIYYKPAPQGTSSDWKNLPGTAQFLSTQTDRRVQEGTLNTKTTPYSHGFKIYRPG
jgi:hypothetical protein